jgi:ATP-dependent Lon protease
MSAPNPKMIALFPLKLIVFPGEKLNLHIFEPRYKALIQECRTTGMHFAIPPFINNRLMPLATEMELVEVKNEYPNGEMDIETRALRQLRIKEYYTEAPEKEYPGGLCVPFLKDHDHDSFLDHEIHNALAEVFSKIQVQKDLPYIGEKIKLHEFVHQVGMNVQQMYEMYAATKESDSQQIFLDYLKQILPKVTEMDHVRRKVQMNGHFKNLIPPL